MSLSTFARRLFCRHRSVQFMRNIYGDEINECGGKRSMWCCQSCGAVVLRSDLHPLPSRTPPAPPMPPRRVYADAAPAPSPSVGVETDQPWPRVQAHSWHAESSPEPVRFASGGGGDFGGGGASSSWDTSSSSSCDSSSSSSDSGSSSCSSD